MKKLMSKIAKGIAFVPGMLMVAGVHAAEVTPITPSSETNIKTLLNNVVIPWVTGIAGLLAVVVLIVGGVRYILAAGNEKAVGAAKNTIIYAIIGLIVIIVAYVIVNTIVGALK